MFRYKFKFRGFVSLLTLFSFLISLVSGIVLYFTPQGKIANWTNWTFWGLDKHMWGALHINSALIFFIIIIFHIYYNWKLLWAYIKKRTQAAVNLKLELSIVLLLSTFLIVASVRGIQPFKQILDWNEGMKNYWARQSEAEPPIPHAEEFTVEEFCEKMNISIDDFEAKMKSKDWEFEIHQTIDDIAKQNHISPSDIYRHVQGQSTSQRSSGGGWGRMTVAQVCEQYDIPIFNALANLVDNGIHAKATDNIRVLANQIGARPSAIIGFITGANISH